MTCPRCQAENDAGARFCGDCGARLEAACPNCGTLVTPGKKFCRSCGVALTTQPVGHFASPGSYTPRHRAEKILTSKSALEGERKQVTVLFADLKGSMELSTGPLSRLCSNRVAGLRTRAKAMSLDPNVWFENVELVAAQEIGEVTVMYVRNIYKYYVAYQLPRDQSQLL